MFSDVTEDIYFLWWHWVRRNRSLWETVRAHLKPQRPLWAHAHQVSLTDHRLVQATVPAFSIVAGDTSAATLHGDGGRRS